MLSALLLALLLQSAQLAARDNPSSPLAGHTLVYSARERCVLRIGGDAAGPQAIQRLVGAGWIPIPGSELPARSLPAVAVDEQGDVLMHGGAVGHARADGSIDFEVTADTWRWDGKTWTRVATSGPAARDHHAMVFDSHRKTFVLFGGSDADPSGRSVLYGDTWEWGGERWELVCESGPSARAHHAMVFDPARERTILLGGNDERGSDPRTWAWDGTSWKAVAEGPPAGRSAPRLAWDFRRARAILFGGESGRRRERDTWAWDGTRWSVVASDGPPGRTVHALAFDEARGVAVLFGGADRNTVLGDLWELSDEGWIQRGR